MGNWLQIIGYLRYTSQSKCPPVSPFGLRPSPDGLLYQLWYLDDGALISSHSALATFLDDLHCYGQGFGLCPNFCKCGVFWPSGQQDFSELPTSVWRVVLSHSSGAVFLGSPVWCPTSFFASFISSVEGLCFTGMFAGPHEFPGGITSSTQLSWCL